MAQRRGRGRLSSIEMLPEHAEAEVAVALEQLAERKITQVEILDALNARLAALDPPVEPISKSAFNRFTLRFAAQSRRLTEAREAAAALAERMEDMPEGDVGLMLGETIKALLNDILLDRMVDGGSVAIGDLRAAAEAVQRLEAARKASHETQAKARAAVMKRAAEAVDAAVAEGRIEAEAAQRAREIMGFA
jgi:hypothetical protein